MVDHVVVTFGLWRRIAEERDIFGRAVRIEMSESKYVLLDPSNSNHADKADVSLRQYV